MNSATRLLESSFLHGVLGMHREREREREREEEEEEEKKPQGGGKYVDIHIWKKSAST